VSFAGRRFNARLAAVLGTEAAVAERLVADARQRLPRRAYLFSAAAFLIATSPVRVLLTRGVRERAIASLVGPMLASPWLQALYLDLR
jgi:hypothetical protein